MAHNNIWNDKGVHRMFTDKITDDEILRSNLYLHGEPRFDHLTYVLNDFTEIDDFYISEHDVK